MRDGAPLSRWAGWAVRRPRRCIGLIALVATLVSAWPVVFAGKSMVSPNFGTELLYDHFPTLPGSSDPRTVSSWMSDVGAMDWQDAPYSAIEARSLLRDGAWPLWNRDSSGGVPLLGQGQSMLGDPLQLGVIAARGAAWAWDLKFLAAKALFAAALGLIVLELVGQLPSALLVALAAPFIGFFAYRINHPACFSLCYAPLVLYFHVRIALARTGRHLAGALVGVLLSNLALLSSGTVREGYVLLAAMNLCGWLAIAAAEADARERLRKLGWTAALLVLFAGMSAPAWAGFLDALRHAYYTVGGGPPRAEQVPPNLMIGAFDEAFFRPYVPGGGVYDPALNFLFLGGVLYFLATLRHQAERRVVFALALCSLLPLSLAFGFVPPGFIAKVPFLNRVSHVDDAFLCVLLVLWPILAGAGFATAARRVATPDGRWDLGISALLLLALVFLYAAFGHAVPRTLFPNDRFGLLQGTSPVAMAPWLVAYFGVVTLALLAFGLLARVAVKGGAGGPLACAGMAVCGIVFLWQGSQAPEPALHAPGPTSDFAHLAEYRVAPPERADFLAPSAAVELVRRACASEPARTVGLGLNLVPGWAGFYGLEDISGPDALMDPQYRELTAAMHLDRRMDWMLYVAPSAWAEERADLDFLNVRYYLASKGSAGQPPPGVVRVASADLDVYESPTAWPRAFFTSRVFACPTADALVRRLHGADRGPFAALGPKALAAGPAWLRRLAARPGAANAAPAFGYRLKENSTAFSIRAAGPGLAVLMETNWPGYPHAALDGRPVPTLTVNSCFSGVAIASAGLHRIVVEYRPRRFRALEGVAALSLLAAIGLCAAAARTRRA